MTLPPCTDRVEEPNPNPGEPLSTATDTPKPDTQAGVDSHHSASHVAGIPSILEKDSYPHRLSGGERARVALMCAMCARPQVLLLDEPFRGLDQLTKEQCMADLARWLDETEHNEIVILVSHDISDAVSFSDEVIVVRSKPLCLHDRFLCPSNKTVRSQELIDLKDKVLTSLKASLPSTHSCWK